MNTENSQNKAIDVKEDSDGTIILRYQEEYEKYRIILTSTTKKLTLDSSYLKNNNHITLEFVLVGSNVVKNDSLAYPPLLRENFINKSPDNKSNNIDKIIVNIKKLDYDNENAIESAARLISELQDCCYMSDNYKRDSKKNAIKKITIEDKNGPEEFDNIGLDGYVKTLQEKSERIKRLISNESIVNESKLNIGTKIKEIFLKFLRFYNIDITQVQSYTTIMKGGNGTLETIQSLIKKDMHNIDFNYHDPISELIESLMPEGIKDTASNTECIACTKKPYGTTLDITTDVETIYNITKNHENIKEFHTEFVETMLYHIIIYGHSAEDTDLALKYETSLANKFITQPNIIYNQSYLANALVRRIFDKPYFINLPSSLNSDIYKKGFYGSLHTDVSNKFLIMISVLINYGHKQNEGIYEQRTVVSNLFECPKIGNDKDRSTLIKTIEEKLNAKGDDISGLDILKYRTKLINEVADDEQSITMGENELKELIRTDRAKMLNNLSILIKLYKDNKINNIDNLIKYIEFVQKSDSWIKFQFTFYTIRSIVLIIALFILVILIVKGLRKNRSKTRIIEK